MAGGGEGARGENKLGRVDGNGKIHWKHVGPTAEIELNVGDIIKILTPGGGGYGRAGEHSEPGSEQNGGNLRVGSLRAGGSLGLMREAMNSSQ